jgi:uncharacterized protein YqjF (DUF2071 family)
MSALGRGATRAGRAPEVVSADPGRTIVRFRVADTRERVPLDHRTASQRGRIHAASQTWTSLLFAHYRADPDALASLLPPGVALDLYDGEAWITISPFRVVLRPLPDVPWPMPTVSFLEVNVRTYARVAGEPGIVFFTLDATSRIAVWGARRLYRLPYRSAHGALRREGPYLRFTTERRASATRFSAVYRPVGAPRYADPGSLEQFLVERYRLYARDCGGLVSADIHHRPWLIASAESTVEATELLRDLPVIETNPLTHYCSRQDVLTWLPRHC